MAKKMFQIDLKFVSVADLERMHAYEAAKLEAMSRFGGHEGSAGYVGAGERLTALAAELARRV